MLVYYKEPKGVLCFLGQKVYGYATNMPPSDLKYEIYEKYRDVLVNATYREGYLSKIFKTKISPIAFTIDELEYLPTSTIKKLGHELGIIYNMPKTISSEIIRRLQYGS